MSTPVIDFKATVELLKDTYIVRLPEVASRQLPSRGQVAVHMTADGQTSHVVIEPDGRLGHWLKLPISYEYEAGQEITVDLKVTKAWPEPVVPADLQAALDDAPADVVALWPAITPMARWEWVRWVNATNNPETRQRRVEVSISKMLHGKRRPCCFNLSACTDPLLARNAQLITSD